VLKVIGYWTGPADADDAAAFEDAYLSEHVPTASRLPGLQRIVTTRICSGYHGGEPLHYRVTELFFEDEDALQRSFETPEYAELGRQTGAMIERFGASVEAEVGEEDPGAGREGSTAWPS
jgi:uncharacterized protein (TIGR02118 family)